MDFQNWLRRYAVTLFFVLTYAITWGSIMAVTGVARFQGEYVPFEHILMAFGAMLAGPGFTALVLTAIGDGETGIKVLGGYLTRWKVGLHWYIIAVFTAPLTVLVVLLTLTAAVSPLYTPAFSPAGLAIGLLAGFFGEIGWTGYALPRLRQRFSPLSSAVLLGLLWGLWHLLADFTGSIPGQEGYWFASFILFWLAPLVAYRVLMVWVHTNTRSLLVAQIMHAAYFGSLFVLRPALEPDLTLIYHAALSIGLWLAGAVIVLLTGKDLTRRPARLKPVALSR